MLIKIHANLTSPWPAFGLGAQHQEKQCSSAIRPSCVLGGMSRESRWGRGNFLMPLPSPNPSIYYPTGGCVRVAIGTNGVMGRGSWLGGMEHIRMKTQF